MQEVQSENLINKQLLFRAIGNVIRQHRLEQGKSMYVISAECGLSRSTWRDIELALCKEPALSTIWRISEAIEIPLEVLICEIKMELNENFSLTGLN